MSVILADSCGTSPPIRQLGSGSGSPQVFGDLNEAVQRPVGAVGLILEVAAYHSELAS